MPCCENDNVGETHIPLSEMESVVSLISQTTQKGKSKECLELLEKQILADTIGRNVGAQKPPTLKYWESLLHMVKANTGSGMFAMGNAFKHAGLLFAPFLFLVLGTICVYGNHIMLNCSKELGRRRKLEMLPTYADTVEWSFQEGPQRCRLWGRPIRIVVNIFNMISQLGYCSVYIIFIASTCKTVSHRYGYELEIHLVVAVIFVPILASAMVNRFKYLVPFSMIATIAMALGLVLCLYISMQDLPPITSRPALAELDRLPFFFGTSLFCFEGIAMILPLQREMKSPEQLSRPLGVLNMGMTIIGCISVGMGFVGYLKYGEQVAESISLNLPHGQLTDIVQIAISTSLLFSYSLQIHVAVKLIWPDFNKKYGPFKHPTWAEIGVRVGLSFITCVVFCT